MLINMIHHQHLVYLHTVSTVILSTQTDIFLSGGRTHLRNDPYIELLISFVSTHTLPTTHTHKYTHCGPHCLHIGYLKTCMAFENMNTWKKQKCWHKYRKHPGEQTKGGFLGKFNLPIISLSPKWSEYFSFIFVQVNMLHCLPFQQSEIH